MKKKVLIVSLVLITIISAMLGLVACVDEPDPPGPNGNKNIKNINDLSIMMGKDYLYPVQDKNIESIYVAETIAAMDFSEVKYYEVIRNVDIKCKISNVETTIRLEKYIDPNNWYGHNLEELIKDPEVAKVMKVYEVNELKVYQIIDKAQNSIEAMKNANYVWTILTYKDMRYEIKNSSIFDDNQTDLTNQEEAEAYAKAVRDYIATFKKYA